jgi:AmmeMemoRadiSam system protein A
MVKMEAPLSQEEKDHLLDLAYAAVKAAACGDSPPPTGESLAFPRLQENGASFVTITLEGQLRGCIGTIYARFPLVQDVVLHAADAAIRDPRFPPLGADEANRVSIEVSVLTKPEPLAFRRREDIPSLLKPGIDGVVLRRDRRQATFLPQVWEKVSDPEDFLGRLCEKAYLSCDAWRSEPVEIFTYQVESFHRR